MQEKKCYIQDRSVFSANRGDTKEEIGLFEQMSFLLVKRRSNESI